jgi:hypothetical protein
MSYRWLIWSGTLELLVSSVLGFLLLIPMQPWGKNFFRGVKNPQDLRSTHIDWLLLAFLQFAVAFGLSVMPIGNQTLVISLTMFGAWMNATPYLIRGVWGINAFSLSGDWKQVCSASLALVSVASLLTALFLLVIAWW